MVNSYMSVFSSSENDYTQPKHQAYVTEILLNSEAS